MPVLKGPRQSSFIPSRLTTDNIIVAQEIVHSLQRKKGKLGGCVAKINLEKAYDRVEWTFLRQILTVTGFQAPLQDLIMNIVTSTSLRVCWNGELLPTFHPSQSLCQGDPLSPYLFVLCMETLHHRISHAVQEKLWTSIRVVRWGTSFSHLFFVDDLLLFGQASYSQAKIMEHILVFFCQDSRQLMNRHKSVLWFSPNTPGYLKHSISSGLGVTCASSLGTYLGVPLIHGRV